MTRYWHTTDALELDDSINEVIWRDSPGIQREIAQPCDAYEGAVGAAQGMVGDTPLPWVPDLVGKDWRSPDAVLVFGSSYADFFTPLARRDNRMSLEEYREADSSRVFQSSFVRDVVGSDNDYYNEVAELLVRAGVPPTSLVLSDLCRASFVEIIPGKADANEGVLKAHKSHFYKE